MNSNSFTDVYFGELVDLWKDVKAAPSFKNKLLYIFMPPGWSHVGEYETASTLRHDALESIKK
jgi:hypothetical protein